MYDKDYRGIMLHYKYAYNLHNIILKTSNLLILADSKNKTYRVL